MKKGLCVFMGLSVVLSIATMALAMEKGSLKLAGDEAGKTFTIDGSTPVGDNHLEDQNDGYAEYNQTVSEVEGTFIHIENSYTGTDYQTVEFNNAGYYLKGTAPASTVASAQMTLDFGVKGLTSLSYDVTLGTPYEYGSDFSITVYDGDGNAMGEATEAGNQTLPLSEGSGVSASVRVYFYGYESYTLTSITFNYDCVGLPAA
jgi:hypothetical protein